MPRIIYTIYNTKDLTQKKVLNSVGYEQALEEALFELGFTHHDITRLGTGVGDLEMALNDLGWAMSRDVDAPYQDEHMMSMQSRGGALLSAD
jgi:hypothetical protein